MFDNERIAHFNGLADDIYTPERDRECDYIDFGVDSVGHVETMQPMETARGFLLINFLDSNEEECLIQESSKVGEESYIWFGNERNGLRMHLSQALVIKLLPILQHFAKTGSLSLYDVYPENE